jgi:hypothetical protein
VKGAAMVKISPESGWEESLNWAQLLNELPLTDDFLKESIHQLGYENGTLRLPLKIIIHTISYANVG